MIFFKPNICFKIKTLEDTANCLISRIQNSHNSYEVQKLKECVNIDDFYIDNVKAELKNDYNLTISQAEKQLQSIEKYWKEIQNEFFIKLSKVLDFDINGEVQGYCMIDCLPLPYIDLKRRSLSLSVNDSLDNNVRFALGLIVKYFVLNKFLDSKVDNIVYNYNKDSVYWIMADLVADSIFFHTELKKFAQNTAYKYYYDLKINATNLIDYIRGVYPTMNIIDFMGYVLEFVEDNLSVFTKFTNRY